MKKQLKYIVILAGFLFLILGTIIYFMNDNKEEDKKDYIIVDTTNKIGETIDNSIYEEYKIDKYLTESLKSTDIDIKNTYTIPYSNNLINYSSSDKSITFVDDLTNINASCIYNNDFETYKESFVDYYKENNYEKMNVAYSKEPLKMSGYDIEYLKINSIGTQNNFNEELKKEYTEQFVVLIKESDISVCTVSFSVTSKRLSDEMLTEFINKIKIEKGTASYLYSKLENDKIVGTLNKKLVVPKEKSYELSYEIPSSKYEEIEDYRNSPSSTTFVLKNNENTVINIELSMTLSSENFYEKYFSNVESRYLNSPEFILNDIEYSDVTNDGKEYYQIELNYSDKVTDVKTFVKHLVYEIEDGTYYIIVCSSNEEIEESIINDFLNIEI